MAKKDFWNGFAAGASAGAAATFGVVAGLKLIGQIRNGRVLRFEQSLQVGCPVDEVFAAWSDLSQLPRLVDFIESVEQRGSRSHWTVNLAGRHMEWDAEITQRMRNQALGWKSRTGPKHTGRIDFSPIGTDTLMHVTMNYCPPGQLARLFSPLQNPIEHYIGEAFRQFKAGLEGKGREGSLGARSVNTSPTMQRNMSPTPAQMGADVTGTPALNEAERATGTYGHLSESDLNRRTQSTRFGGPESTVEYTRPPEAKS